jgi:hypothetical protein
VTLAGRRLGDGVAQYTVSARGRGLADQTQPAHLLLDYLERANLFLIPLDDEQCWYRYHNLFADVLRSRLKQIWPALVSEEDLFRLARYLGHQQQRQEDEAQAKRILHYLQETLGDPLVGLSLMIDRAQDNLRRYKARQPLVGHLLPYLMAHEAQQHGLHFRKEHGWIEEAQAKHVSFVDFFRSERSSTGDAKIITNK